MKHCKADRKIILLHIVVAQFMYFLAQMNVSDDGILYFVLENALPSGSNVSFQPATNSVIPLLGRYRVFISRMTVYCVRCI